MAKIQRNRQAGFEDCQEFSHCVDLLSLAIGSLKDKANPTVKMFAGPEPKNLISHFSRLKPSPPLVVYQKVRVVTGLKRLGVGLPCPNYRHRTSHSSPFSNMSLSPALFSQSSFPHTFFFFPPLPHAQPISTIEMAPLPDPGPKGAFNRFLSTISSLFKAKSPRRPPPDGDESTPIMDWAVPSIPITPLTPSQLPVPAGFELKPSEPEKEDWLEIADPESKDEYATAPDWLSYNHKRSCMILPFLPWWGSLHC